MVQNVSKTIVKFDLFGQRVPSFRLDGDSEVTTKIGGLISILLIAITFLFARLKL